jgi:hypothetical protein
MAKAAPQHLRFSFGLEEAKLAVEESPSGWLFFLRELVLPLGSTFYVALFEIVDASIFSIDAIRHQREDEYY